MSPRTAAKWMCFWFAAVLARAQAAAVTQPVAACGGPAVTIPVYSERDINIRRRHANSQTVILRLHATIRLRNPLVLDGNFSCTQFISAAYRRFTLFGPSTSSPVLSVMQARNVLVHGINFHLPISSVSTMAPCTFPGNPLGVYLDTWHCPAVWIYGCYATQVVQGVTNGRVDVVGCSHSRVDSMRVVVPPGNRPGAILVQHSGNAPSLTRCNVDISNNALIASGTPGTGAAVGLMLFRGSVGANVYNNYIQDFTLASLQLGYGQGNTGDAMLHFVANNDIVHRFGQLGDCAGIYFDTHWANPGNVLRCNYVRGGGHCAYLDYVSSGITMDGTVCVRTGDGLKLNTGKNNLVTGMLVVDSKEPLNGYISCQNYDVNSCHGPYPAQKWVQDIYTYYQSPTMKKRYPWLTSICNRSRIWGVHCNWRSAVRPAVTGGCSGLPTENQVEIVSATTDGSGRKTAIFCDVFPAVTTLNPMNSLSMSIADAQFISAGTLNFGLRAASPIRKAFPRFRSCPYTSVGPKPVPFAAYLRLYGLR